MGSAGPAERRAVRVHLKRKLRREKRTSSKKLADRKHRKEGVLRGSKSTVFFSSRG